MDYLVPIIADGDTGHGGLSAVMKLVKLFVEVSVHSSVCAIVEDTCVLEPNCSQYTLNFPFQNRQELQEYTLKTKSPVPRNVDTWVARS